MKAAKVPIARSIAVTVTVTEIGNGYCFFRDVVGAEYRLRLARDGTVALAPIDARTRRVRWKEEQPVTRGGMKRAPAVRWTGNQNNRHVILDALRRSGFRDVEVEA